MELAPPPPKSGTTASGRPPLRPLMLTAQFLPETFGGAEQQALRLSQALVELGHQPVVLTSRSDPKTPAQSLMKGVLVTRLLTPFPPQLGGRHLRSTYLWFAQIARYFREMHHDIDVIHCHQAKLNAWIGVRMGNRYGIPVVVKPGSAGPNFDLLSLERKRYLYGRIAARDIANGADRFVSISQDITADLRKYRVPQSRIVHIPNGVVTRAAPPSRHGPQLRSSRDQAVFVFAGRIERQKNIDTLLTALAKIRDRNWRAFLLGDGTGLARAKEQAIALGLQDRCHFRGRVDDPGPWLSMADFFLLPALAEGMSNALLEAMAAGCIPIASRVSGNTDLISDNANGFLYAPPRDATALASRLCQALDLSMTQRRAFSEAARVRVAKDNAMTDVCNRYAALYQTLRNTVEA